MESRPTIVSSWHVGAWRACALARDLVDVVPRGHVRWRATLVDARPGTVV